MTCGLAVSHGFGCPLDEALKDMRDTLLEIKRLELTVLQRMPLGIDEQTLRTALWKAHDVLTKHKQLLQSL